MIKLVLVDIEGTVSSISFVKDVMFPYARKHLADYLKKHWSEPHVAEICRQSEEICGKKLTLAEIEAVMIQWMDEDKKITPLKSIQGYIWDEGFKSGAFKAHLYNDAVDKLRSWKAQGIILYVYSSGSVMAQKLFFAHTEAGDMTSIFSGYFDTTTGGKKEKASYEKIAELTGEKPENILFLSDIEDELNAASSAGMKTILIDRVKNISESRHKIFTDFSNIELW